MKKRTPETSSAILKKLFEEIDRQNIHSRIIQKKSGVHPVSLSAWRHGRVSPLITNVEVVAQVLGYRIVLEKIDVT